MARLKVMALAPVIVDWFLADDQLSARAYRDVVRVYRDAQTHEPDLYAEYLGALRDASNSNDSTVKGQFEIANEHDVANLHHAVWLLLLHALSRLLNYNVHGKWADPPGGASTQGRYDDDYPAGPFALSNQFHFHTTPNLYGSYAISSQDIPAPDLGIGEAPNPPASPEIKKTDHPPLGNDEIKDIARQLARKLADRTALDSFGQHPYHRVVKRFYLDRQDHTTQYAIVIGSLLYPKEDPRELGIGKRAAEFAGRISDNDFAQIHRATWLFLAHRFSYLVGINPFGSFGPVTDWTTHVDLPLAIACPRVFEVPNKDGQFRVNLEDIDPDELG